MDNLEEYLMKHRGEMDRYVPSPGIWRRIRNELKGNKGINYRWLSIAASVLIIIGFSVLFLRPGGRSLTGKNGDDNRRGTAPGNSQLKETEIYYNNLANTMYREAIPMLSKYPDVEKELITDMSQIDSICTDIRKDLKDNVANQDVIEALIQNYRIKIRLLEDMLKVLKENEENPEKKKSHEL